MSATIYKQLMDGATISALTQIRSELAEYLGRTETVIAEALAHHLRAAYTEGVRDGFQQGLAAAEVVSSAPEDGKETA